MNCPVCNKEMKYKEYHEEGYIVEYEYDCPNDCYYEHYAYGNTEIQIAKAILRYTYNTSKNDIKYIKRQINMLTELEQEYRANGCKLYE